jgi:hypothetical protein
MWEWVESGFGYPDTNDQSKIHNPPSAQQTRFTRVTYPISFYMNYKRRINKLILMALHRHNNYTTITWSPQSCFEQGLDIMEVRSVLGKRAQRETMYFYT